MSLMSSRFLLLVAIPLALVACQPATLSPSINPDYRIRVMKTEDGAVAVPPECPNWVDYQPGILDNHPWPQFGCATARNLALMVEEPQDLVEGREMEESRGLMGATALRRYYGNKVKTLLDPTSASPANSGGAVEQAVEGYR